MHYFGWWFFRTRRPKWKGWLQRQGSLMVVDVTRSPEDVMGAYQRSLLSTTPILCCRQKRRVVADTPGATPFTKQSDYESSFISDGMTSTDFSVSRLPCQINSSAASIMHRGWCSELEKIMQVLPVMQSDILKSSVPREKIPQMMNQWVKCCSWTVCKPWSL